MKKPILITIALLLLLGGGVAAYLYLQDERPLLESTEVKEVEQPAMTPEPPEPVARQVLETPTENPELPQLESSDSLMASALENLLENKALMRIFINDQLIRNIVVTIDSLPRKQASMKIMPIKKAPGQFLTIESEGQKVISPNNKARYSQYVSFAEAVDPKQLVTLYRQLYPLFQKAYEELGYPDTYFNDRMMVTLDNLLATPDVNEPIPLIRPKFFYLYADPNLESRSIGQRILMRIGSNHAALIKSKLGFIKQELMLHMHEEKLTDAN
jgi:DUF3014 family protein